jgi:hypothetical protein
VARACEQLAARGPDARLLALGAAGEGGRVQPREQLELAREPRLARELDAAEDRREEALDAQHEHAERLEVLTLRHAQRPFEPGPVLGRAQHGGLEPRGRIALHGTAAVGLLEDGGRVAEVVRRELHREQPLEQGGHGRGSGGRGIGRERGHERGRGQEGPALDELLLEGGPDALVVGGGQGPRRPRAERRGPRRRGPAPTLDVAGRGPAEKRLDAAELGGPQARDRVRIAAVVGALEQDLDQAHERLRGDRGRQQQAGRARLGQEAPERPLERLAMHDRPRQRDLLPAQIEHQGPGRIHAGQHGVQVLDAGAAQAALAREASDDPANARELAEEIAHGLAATVAPGIAGLVHDPLIGPSRPRG